MKKVVVLCLLGCLAFPSFGQKYGLAAGARLGDQRFGLSVRHRIIKSFSAETMVEIAPQLVQFNLYPKYHLPLLGEGFNLYFGVGGHIGKQKEVGNVYGFGFMSGLEWKLPAVPITLSADIKPAYYVQGADWFEFPAAISVHYVLTKSTKKARQKVRQKRKRKKERRERREERKEKRKEWWDSLGSSADTD